MRPGYLLVIALLLMPPGAAQDDPLTLEQRSWLDEHGSIRVGLVTDGPPNGFLEDGELNGFATDLAQLAALKVGAHLEIVPITLSEVAASLETGHVHVTGIWADRADLRAFGVRTAPVAWVPITFVTVDHPEFVTRDDLTGRIGVLNGSIMEARLQEEFPHLEPVPYANQPEGVRLLVDGEVNALLGPLPSMGYELANQGIRRGLPVGEPLSVEPTTFWANAGDPIPGQIMDAGIARMSAEEMSIIHVKWTGFDLSAPADAVVVETVPEWVPLVAWVFVAVTVVALAFVITLRRRVATATNRLARLNADLEIRIEERTAALAAQSAALEESNEHLERFAYMASHDLQAPLRHLASYADLLEDDLGTDISEAARENLTALHASVDRMRARIQGLLAFSRAQRTALKREDIDMAALMDDVVADLATEINAQGATVTWQDLPTVRADPGLLAEVMQNLVQNAVKYDGDAPPRVEVTGHLEGETAVLVVKDNGRGFRPEDRERMFEMFKRVSKDSSGSGIGLALCRLIMERHEGTIDAEGTPGNGASFTLRWPLEPQSPA